MNYIPPLCIIQFIWLQTSPPPLFPATINDYFVCEPQTQMWVKGRIGDVAVAFAYCWHSSCATLHCNNCSGIPTGYAPSHFLSTYELLCTHIHICMDGIVVHIGPDYESTTYYVTQIHIHQPLPFHCLAPICVCVCVSEFTPVEMEWIMEKEMGHPYHAHTLT